MMELFCKNSERLLAVNFFCKSPNKNARRYCLQIKKKQILILFYILFHNLDFVNCPAFVDIKQTLRYKLAIE